MSLDASGAQLAVGGPPTKKQKLSDPVDAAAPAASAAEASAAEVPAASAAEALAAASNAEDEIPWQDTGHKWIGKKLVRTFVRGKKMFKSTARVTKWAPADGEDPALWHIVHDDGDEEDLEDYEVEATLRQMLNASAPGKKDLARLEATERQLMRAGRAGAAADSSRRTYACCASWCTICPPMGVQTMMKTRIHSQLMA